MRLLALAFTALVIETSGLVGWPAVLEGKGAASGAAHGFVVLRKGSCDYFLVETPAGYDLLEWYGGNDPARADELTGNFEEYGFHDIYNLTADEELRVWVEDYWLSKSSGLERLYDKCD